MTVPIYIPISSATAVAICPAGAEKLSANNQVARLPYTLFHCICSYHHSTFWQKNQENLSDKQTFLLSTYFVSQYSTSLSIVCIGTRSSKIVKICFTYFCLVSLHFVTKQIFGLWKEMVFCYQNCSDLLWEKIVLVIT